MDTLITVGFSKGLPYCAGVVTVAVYSNKRGITHLFAPYERLHDVLAVLAPHAS